MYCTIRANYKQTRSTRGLSATAELLVTTSWRSDLKFGPIWLKV